MKIVFLITAFLGIIIFSNAFSQAEKKSIDEKKFTQDELDQDIEKAVAEKVEKQVDEKIKKITANNLVNFSKELLNRENELNQKDELIKKREDILAINEKSLMTKIKDFDEKQQKILGCMSQNDENAKNRVNHLVKVISSMKPVNAAQVLSTQDPDISVRILATLDATQAAKIFNLMEKEVSARLQKQYLNMKQ
jgi:flagellar motility protein MotE (MotC chaperone)